MASSFPYLAIAKRYNVPYALVLWYADQAETADQIVKIDAPWAHATQAAVWMESYRRAKVMEQRA